MKKMLISTTVSEKKTGLKAPWFYKKCSDINSSGTDQLTPKLINVEKLSMNKLLI